MVFGIITHPYKPWLESYMKCVLKGFYPGGDLFDGVFTYSSISYEYMFHVIGYYWYSVPGASFVQKGCTT